MRRLLALALLTCVLAPAHARDGVRIYRCTDANGKQSLRDTPCPRGQQQQARDMLRPRDAPHASAAPRPARQASARAVPPAVVYLAPPRPMFECTTPDGLRYTSETADGNPRWVPHWTLGYPQHGWRSRLDPGRGGFRPAPSVHASVGRPQLALPGSSPPHHHHHAPWPVASGGGTWIRDHCALLPPADTCARLHDRRADIRTRFFNAMPSERDVLRREERSINARLDNDCGGR